MTLLKKFNETGQEIGSEDVSINETNLPQAIEQYGLDWAKGYNAAFTDIMKEITGMMTRNCPRLGEVFSTPQVIGRKVEKFHAEKSLTLENMVQLLSDPKLKL